MSHQTDDAFIIGNGSQSPTPPASAIRSNAFRITFEGDVHSASNVYTSGADYAEMFEWQDGNAAKEDRVGYFVTLDNGKIRKAAATDGFVAGVVSATPSVVGDTHGCGWKDMYVRDDWGRIVYEWIDVPEEALEIDSAPIEPEEIQLLLSAGQEAGKAFAPSTTPEERKEQMKVIDEHMRRVQEERLRALQSNPQTPMIRVQQPKLNPAYDPNKRYVPRSERPEWAAVGLVGKLRVRDDGTCKPNGFCKPNADGIATASEQGYLVLQRLSGNIVLILSSPFASH